MAGDWKYDVTLSMWTPYQYAKSLTWNCMQWTHWIFPRSVGGLAWCVRLPHPTRECNLALQSRQPCRSHFRTRSETTKKCGYKKKYFMDDKTSTWKIVAKLSFKITIEISKFEQEWFQQVEKGFQREIFSLKNLSKYSNSVSQLLPLDHLQDLIQRN